MARKQQTVDPLAMLTASATKAKPKAKDTLDLHQVSQSQAADTLTAIGLSVVSDKIEAALLSRVNEVKDRSFMVWTQNMWDGKKQPQNLKILVKDDAGRDDATMTFQVRFRSDGFKNVFPDELPEDKTVQDFILEALTGDAVGLSEKNALDFVKKEVLVTQQLAFAGSLDQMFNHKDEDIQKSAKKLLALMTGTADAKPLNDMDRSVLLRTQQIVALKDGLFERVFEYCRNIDELRKLLRLVKASFAASNFNFAISSTEKERVSRLEAIAREFVTVD